MSPSSEAEGLIPLRHLPNLISILRILLVPVLVLLLLRPSRTGAVLAALTFFLACWSDFLDGYLARRYGITSRLGKLLDPLADKLIVMAALVMLAAMSRTPRVPGWVVVLIVGRELAVTGLRAMATSEGIVLAAEELGKYKTIFQMLALHGLLLHYTFFGIDFFAGGMYFLWPSLVLSLWSGVDYHVRVLRRAMRPA
ncbi:MAG TPA: CDP-diacylglycerol--glycerol-3-phosphate 3-phosphatidyltransferase [Candidatus Dormibacteraeota bacterium]|nr:CDP-diacylglycerol--glycerol-3-phosphate 3-phosphatidyltransferase [Candidatus Dormibacteraeota bacterium]